MTQLQDKNTNLNDSYSGDIDFSKDLYAYIDESGDEGFDFTKDHVSRWFNVSAIMMTPETAADMIDYVKDYNAAKPHPKALTRLTAKDLNHSQRKDLFFGLSRFNFITAHSLFYKPEIDPKNRLVTYPSMYFVGVKNLIERMSWCVKQYCKRRIHIIVSGRNSIKSEDLKRYLFEVSFRANKNFSYIEKLGIVKVGNITKYNQLLLADYSAYTIRMAFEELGNPPCTEPQYFNWFQRGKLYSSNHSSYGGVWRNGLKITPDDKNLLKNISDILDEGSHKL